MDGGVAERIRRTIGERGPITFAEFMEQALYGPGGFYEEPPVGPEGHFVTSPHVHPIFAELLLRAIAELGAGPGVEPIPVVEVGAGDGTLATDLLRLSEETGGPRLDLTTVERSAGARAKLAELPVTVRERVGDLEPLDPAVVFANEVLDNLPFRRLRLRDGEPVEVLVDAGPDGFREVEAPCEDDLVPWAKTLAPGQEVTVPVEALRFIDDVAARLRRGYVLLIDYGAAGPPAGPAHGYRDHRPWDDVLRDPGTADITAGVDFGALVRHAGSRGLVCLAMTSQRDALDALGFADWIHEQRERQATLLANGAGARATGVWEGRSRASLLVDDRALGKLRWLLLATGGLPCPTWGMAPRREPNEVD